MKICNIQKYFIRRFDRNIISPVKENKINNRIISFSYIMRVYVGCKLGQYQELLAVEKCKNNVQTDHPRFNSLETKRTIRSSIEKNYVINKLCIIDALPAWYFRLEYLLSLSCQQLSWVKVTASVYRHL